MNTPDPETFEERCLCYLKDEMTDDEKTAFETDLTTSHDLRNTLARCRTFLDELAAAGEPAVREQVNQIIRDALKRGATELHLILQRNALLVQIRTDRQWIHLQSITGVSSTNRIIARLKQMANLNLLEQRSPQSGTIHIIVAKVYYDLFVQTLPTIYGERISMRILSRSATDTPLPLDALGFYPSQTAALRRLIHRSSGVVLIGGNPHSGRGTLAYSLLAEIQAKGAKEHGAKNILTLEETVEILLPEVSQTEIKPDGAGVLNWGDALRAVARCAPDVVYTAVLPDTDTVRGAAEIAAGETLILARVSATGVAAALRDWQEQAGNIPGTVRTLAGAVGLRLVRQVCPDCIVEYRPALDELQMARLSLVEDGPYRHGVGCDTCNGTGFRGRVPLIEILELDDALRRALAGGAATEPVWQEAIRQNSGLWEDARAKIRAGLTTVEEVNWSLFDYPRRAAGNPSPTLAAEDFDLAKLLERSNSF